MDTLQSDPYSRSSLQPYRDASVSFENNNTVLDKHEVVSPRVGMTFETVDLAYQFYLEYGYRAGFGVSKRTSHSVDGVKYRATFVCYKGGIARIKPGLKARRRLVAKTGCKAMMVVKFNASENHWEVVFVELEHNHPCNPEMVRFMMCFKDLPDWQREHRPFNAKTRLNPKIHSGRGRPPNQNKDFMVRSFSQSNYSIEGAGKAGKLRFAEGDVDALLVFFDKMQAQNSNFFYNWDMDDEGKILLSFSLYRENNDNVAIHMSPSSSSRSDTDAAIERLTDTERSGSNGAVVDSPRSRDTGRTSLDNSDRWMQTDSTSVTEDDDLAEDIAATANGSSDTEQMAPDASFEEAMEIMKSRSTPDMPEDLDGGIIFEHTYLVESQELNHLLFRPDSQFFKELRELQGTTDYEEQPWTWKSKDPPSLTRTCQYTKGASKFMKAVKTSEEQAYLKVDGKNFVVMARVRTPEVPFGNCFAVVLLYKIIHSTGLSGGEESAHLTVSYNVEFLQSTMMRSMIEGSVRDGLKENFEGFAEVMSRHVKLADSVGMDKEQLLAPLQAEHQSDIRLAYKYFRNFTAISTVLFALYILVHILLSKPGPLMGLEFNGLDLPDSFGELITAGVLVLQFERLLSMISRFVEARVQRGSDHGVKANGEGWLLTVALLEATSLPPVSCGSVDPYVVFSCNGITRTSSVQLQTQEPQWNEIMEFDAMEEPPAVLDVEVFNFDGPFDLAISLGHAEINFLKHTSVELADIWVPLEGKLAQTCQSRLHLRIFLENTKGPETSMREYLSKMEKEVGKKLHVRSPHRNSTFQKLFSLPQEEFLIADYVCSLKRRLPLQGRLFVSARIVGFYANLFGHKTKFFFLWEDVEEIEVLQPSFTTLGTPSLLFTLKRGRGLEAKSGAKSQDKEGRLKFQFHSFASFSKASRTIIGLWKTKSSAIEQRAKMEEDHEEDASSVDLDDVHAVLSIGDVPLTKEYSLEHPVDADLLMGVFDGGALETRTMSRVGCLDYSATPWEAARPGVLERHVSYKFNRYMSIFGGEMASTQLKFPAEDGGGGWTIHDVVTLHNVPFGDYFRVHLRYNVQSVTSEAPSCRCEILVGIEWLKSSKFQKRIARNICEKLAHRAKEVLEVAGKEIASAVSG